MDHAEVIIKKLRGALRAGLEEARTDPALVGKMSNAICVELGLDPMAAMLISAKLTEVIKKKEG